MRTSLKFLLCLSTALVVAGAAQAKTAQLIPIIPFPDATSTSVFGIADDNNTIAGSYIDTDGNTHGFYGTLDGNYTSFDFGTSGTTQARGISGDGKNITGFSNTADVHCNFPEWQMQVGSAPKQIKKGNALLFGEAQGFNSKNEFAGDYCDTGGSGTIFGELGKKAKWKSDVTTPFGSAYTGERGVNTAGTVVGFYVNPDNGLQIGTVVKGGVASQVVNPGPNETYTVFEGINDANTAAGQWGDTGGIVHSFAYKIKTAKFTEIDDPAAASFTQAWGVNKAGLIAVTSDQGAYIYCDLKPNKCPSTGQTPITVQAREVTASAAKMLRYGDAKSATKHAPIQNKLPKGAALQ